MNIKTITRTTVLFGVLFTIGCSTGFKSSGFITDDSTGDILPEQIPQKIIVIPFSGDPGTAARSTRLFREGLFELDFNIITIDSLSYLHTSSPNEASLSLSPDLLFKLLGSGADGVFTGIVSR